MQLPFTTAEFFRVFETYNLAVWPAQPVLVAIAVGAAGLVFSRLRWADAAISAVLAFLWFWTGSAYHLAFFTSINPLAYAFAVLSVSGALLFLWLGVFRKRLHFRWNGQPTNVVGGLLILFSLVVYPVWTWQAGHGWPAMPTFGLPCPTTLFTIGMLALLERPHPRSPLVVPVLWCAIGAQAAFLLDVTPDLSLLLAGVVGIILWAGARTEELPSGGING